MIRRTFLILVALVGYVYLVSQDPKGNFLSRAQKICNSCYSKYKKMNLEYHVNKWPNKQKRRY